MLSLLWIKRKNKFLSFFLFILFSSIAVAGSVEWTHNLNSTNLFFQHLGSLKLEGGRYKVIKTIDLKSFEDQIISVEKEIWEFTTACYKNNCSLNKDHGNLYIEATKQIKHDLKAVYALLGKYHRKRSINSIGKAFKYLFGTMDNDDEEYLTGVLQDLGKRQDKLHLTMNSTVHLMNEMSKQWETLKENQKIEYDNFLKTKESVQMHFQRQERTEWEIDYRSFGIHLDNFLLSISVQIDKLSKAILFLKSGVVDPYFVDSDELIKVLTYKRLNYQVTPRDVDIILGNSKPIAVFDKGSMMIHIIFLIPIAKDTTFNLYENLIIPKKVGSNVIILDNIPKYLAVSFDNINYFTLESLECFVVFQSYICKNSIFYNNGYERECITDLFYQNNDSNCEYKKLKQKFDVHNILNAGLIMFSTAGITVQLTCSNKTDLKNLTGSYLIEPPRNCTVNSTIFEFDNSIREEETHLVNKIPVITCCSPFYQGNLSNKGDIGSIVLKSLHDIRKIDSEDLGKQLNGWKKFSEVNFKDHVQVWHLTTAMIIIGLIITLLVWTKLKNIFCNDNNNVVVSFRATGNEVVPRNGYPTFGDI